MRRMHLYLFATSATNTDDYSNIMVVILELAYAYQRMRGTGSWGGLLPAGLLLLGMMVGNRKGEMD